MSMRRALFSSKGKLPHTELSYLRSSGTQWINTGIMGSGDISVETSLIIRNNGSGLFGSRISATNKNYSLCVHRSDYNNENRTFTTLPLNTKHLIYKNKGNTYINGVLVTSVPYASFNNLLSIYLFTQNYNNSPNGAFQIYLHLIFETKIWNDTTLVRDFVPVLRNDGVYCMYDKVSKTYFTNSGTDVFSGGM